MMRLKWYPTTVSAVGLSVYKVLACEEIITCAWALSLVGWGWECHHAVHIWQLILLLCKLLLCLIMWSGYICLAKQPRWELSNTSGRWKEHMCPLQWTHVLLICLQLTVGKMRRHLAIRVRGRVMLRVRVANYYTLPSCLDGKKQC